MTVMTFCGPELLLGTTHGQVFASRFGTQGKRFFGEPLRQVYQLSPSGAIRGLSAVSYELPQALQTETERALITILVGGDKQALLFAGPGRGCQELFQRVHGLVHELPGACELSGLWNNVQIRLDSDGFPAGWAWLAAQQIHRKRFGARPSEVEEEGWETVEETPLLEDRGQELAETPELLSQIRTGKFPSNPRKMIAALCGLPSVDATVQITAQQRVAGMQQYAQTLENWFMQAQTATSPLISRPETPIGFAASDREVLVMFREELGAISLATKAVVWLSGWPPLLDRFFREKKIDYVGHGDQLQTYDNQSIFTAQACFRVELVQQPAYVDCLQKAQFEEALEVASVEEKVLVRREYAQALLQRSQLSEAAALLGKTDVSIDAALSLFTEDREARLAFAASRLGYQSIVRAPPNMQKALRDLCAVGVTAGASLVEDLEAQVSQDGVHGPRSAQLGRRLQGARDRLSDFLEKYQRYTAPEALALAGRAAEGTQASKRIAQLLLQAQRHSDADSRQEFFQALEVELGAKEQGVLFGVLGAAHSLDPVRCRETVGRFCGENEFSMPCLLYASGFLPPKDSLKLLRTVYTKNNAPRLQEAILHSAIQQHDLNLVAELMHNSTEEENPWLYREVAQFTTAVSLRDTDHPRAARRALRRGDVAHCMEILDATQDEAQRAEIAHALAEHLLAHGSPIPETFRATKGTVPLLELLQIQPNFELTPELKKLIKETLDQLQDTTDYLGSQLEAAKHSTDSYKADAQRYDRRYVAIKKGSKCAVCAELLEEEYTAFACSHCICQECLVKHYLKPSVSASLKQKYATAAKAGDQKLAEFLAKECVICQADDFLDPIE